MCSMLKSSWNDSLKPNKLKVHLQTHPDHANKNLSYFEALLSNTKAGRLDKTGYFFQKTDAAVTASLEVAKLIAKNKKPHTIGETPIAPCIEAIVVKIMIGEEAVKKVKQVSLSNSTIQRICDMSSNIEEQVVSGIKKSPMFSLQLDESVDVSNKAQLIWRQLAKVLTYLKKLIHILQRMIFLGKICFCTADGVQNP